MHQAEHFSSKGGMNMIHILGMIEALLSFLHKPTIVRQLRSTVNYYHVENNNDTKGGLGVCLQI